jgi:hypothetical protein
MPFLSRPRNSPIGHVGIALLFLGLPDGLHAMSAAPDIVAPRILYVAPSGDDANPGSKTAPLASFRGARDKVRELRGDGDIIVSFSSGYYHFDAPVRLGREDSGSAKRRITYQAASGEQPIFTSGVPIRGWQPISPGDPFYDAIPAAARDHTYVADVPVTLRNTTDPLLRVLVDRNSGWMDRGIYSIAGKIRTPLDSEFSGDVEDAIYYSPEMKKVSELTIDVTELAMPPHGMEIMTWLSDWNIGLVPIESVERTDFGSRVRSTIPATYQLSGGARAYHDNVDFVDSALINCPEGIDAPGKWVINPESGLVYLWPFENARLEEDIFAATLSELILVHGGLPEGAAAWHSDEPVTPVSHITFDSITFTTGRFLHWEDDDPVAQHGWATCDKNNAVLRFRGVEHCAVRNCTFTKSGGVGVRFDLYAQHNSVEGCTFHDLGMEAVHFGGYGAGTRDENHHNIIADNVIGFPGRIKTDAHAITIWNSGHNDIVRNYIHDTPYTPILLAGPRFRVLIRHVDDSVPWRGQFHMQEGAWPMHRWDEIPEIACFTMAVVELDDEGQRLIHQPHPAHPQFPRPSPHPPLDRHAAAFRFVEGNRIQYNTFHNVSRGAFGEAIYVSGTKEPGARNSITDNYMCNNRNAVFPIVWMIYMDGYGRGVDVHRNVVYNSEITFTGFHLANWHAYHGWEWKGWRFEGTPPPRPASANVWIDCSTYEGLIEPAPHVGTVAVNCGDDNAAFHQPATAFVDDYQWILQSIAEGKYPHGGDSLPGIDRVQEVLEGVIKRLE